MQFANYFFASIISFSGLLIGIMLVKIAPEEQKPLAKYFIFAKKILLLMMLIFLLFYYFNDAFYTLTLIVYFTFLLFVEYKASDAFKKIIFIYAVLGILFFLSSKNLNLFAIEASLILLYGLPTASLIHKKREKNHYKILLYSAGFIIIANLLFFA